MNFILIVAKMTEQNIINQFSPPAQNKKNGKRNPLKNSNSFELPGSRVPPHSIESENAVIGSMMLDRGAIAKVIEILDTNSFYNHANKIIFETMLSLFESNISIDIVVLNEELRRRNLLETVGGTFYLMDINSKTPTAANVEYHARIVQERFLKRALIQTSGNILTRCYDDTTDALEEIDNAEAEIFSIAEKRFRNSYQTIKVLAHKTFEIIEKLKARDHTGITGQPSGYTELDDLLGGFQNSDLIILAGRPSMGKTALGLSIARNAAVLHKVPVAFFSIEMAAVQLVIRLISAEAGINQKNIRVGKVSDEDHKKIIKSLGKLADSPLIIDDSAMLSIMELRAKCRRLKAEHGIKMVFVDYLQLIYAPKSESREREISLISQSLKQIAKELEIPVVALAQLNRSVESRSDKRPLLSDLRESGSIEQDADVVMFVNRPEQYGITTYEDKSPTEGTAEIIIGKQRNGPTGTLRLSFIKDYARFENLEYRYAQPDTYIPKADDESPF
ncbi:MAG: replicative helicase [Ignavibacteria bacterium]|nr:replicative helicase [Ignavibacteria bacterium]